MLTRVSIFVSLVVVSVLLKPTFSIAQPTGNVITLDSNITYQTMNGWEAALLGSIYEDTDAALPAFPRVFDGAVNDLGINRVRLEILSGAENTQDYWVQWRNGQIDMQTWKSVRYKIVNDNNDPHVINPNGFHFSQLDYIIDNFVLPLRQRIEANGEKLYINLNYVDFDVSPFEHYTNPQEYAEFMLATFQHVQNKYGFVPDAIEVILEPDNTPWTGTHIGQAIVAAANRLNANGYYPDFIAPSTTSINNVIPYFNNIIAVSNAKKYLTEISYHLYGGNPSTRATIASVAKQHNMDASMLEWWTGSNSYKTLHEDLKVGNNSAWQQGILADEFNPATALYHINLSNMNVTVSPMTKFTRQYYKFIRRGAVRIEAATNNNSFDPLAFINPNRKYVVVVKAGTAGSFSIKGLPPGIYGTKYTTTNQYDVDLPDVIIGSGQNVNASIPGAGVITVYAKSSPPLSVELTSLSAESNGRDVILTWATHSESHNLGFEIQRSQNRQPFVIAGFIRGHETTTVFQQYSFRDTGLPDGKYFYRLKQIDLDGKLEFYGPVEVAVTAFRGFALYQNHPNPFNPMTNIEYSLPKTCQVKLMILNLQGQEIATLVDTLQAAGSYRVHWNAGNLSSGIYLIQFSAGGFTQTKKLLLAK